MSELWPIIRKARKEDMTQVYQLIKELAIFEKLEDQVKITPDILIKDGFGNENPPFKCLVAELQNGEIPGFALYYICYSTWRGSSIFLEDLYVQEKYRRQGIGKKLFLSVAKIAQEASSQRLDFHVLSWNPAIDFYKTLGAENLSSTEAWQLFRLNHDALNKLFS